MAITTARRPILGFAHPSKVKSGTPAGFAMLVWSNDTAGANYVQLPTGARARRLAGILDYDNVAGKTAVADDPVSLRLGQEFFFLLRPPAEGEGSVTVLQGDWIQNANALGHGEPYIPGTGTTELIGASREKHTNSQTGAVPIVAQLHKQLLLQAMEVRGFTRAVLTNTTRYIGNDATELAAVETLFTAPWDGNLQGPFSVDMEASGGTPAGSVTVTLMFKAPGGSWAPLTYDGTNPWAVVVALSSTVTSGDDTSLTLPHGRTVAIVKGTKVGYKSVKDVSVANVAQLNARVAFV